MPLITSGANATIAVSANQILTVIAHGGEYTFENPVGTRVVDSGSSNVFGPFAAAGTVKLTSVQGDLYYEVAAGQAAATSSGVQFALDGSGNVTGLTGPSGVVPLGGGVAALSHWLTGSVSGKKIAWVGDSTTLQLAPVANGGTAGNNAYYLTNYVSDAGSPLNGTTNLFFGANGNSLANFNTNAPSPFGINDVIAAVPDLIVFSYGINDVRLGATTQAQLTALLKTAVNKFRTALPNCDIVLRMPNSFLTTDVSAFGYVSPNASAQAYSDILRNAYLSLENVWPNVVVYKSQLVRFPSVCPATSPYMNDQLHPTFAGYSGIIDDIAGVIGPVAPYNAGAATNAINVSYLSAPTTYPRVVENGDYTLITSGAWVGQGSTWLDFAGDLRQLSNINIGDIVVQNGVAAFALPSTFNASASGSNIRLGGLGAGNPTYAQSGGKVSIYRNKYVGNVANKPYIDSYAYPAQLRVNIAAAGVNYIRLGAATGQKDVTDWNFQPTDYLLHPTLGPVLLSSASYSMSGNNVQINQTADFSTTGTQAILVATGAQRAATQNPQIIQFDAAGTLASVTLTRAITRGGLYSKVSAFLGTAGTVASTIVLAADGVTFATVTFAISATSGTVAWASGSSAQIRASQKITAAITAGTGAADMSIALDALT